MAAKQALVFGASGISGWAITRECLTYPTEDTFGRIITLSNKKLQKEEFLISGPSLDRLELVSGIDLTKDLDVVSSQFAAISGIENTTHVFYAAYASHGSELQTLKKINVDLFDKALKSVIKHCPNLEFFSLQTGTKTYGFEYYGKPGFEYSTPYKETQPRLPEPYGSNIFYYQQWDSLVEAAKGQKWKYCEVRPDAIIGFAPRSNGMGFAQSVGIYLAMFLSVEGKGAECVFPGGENVWKNLHTDSSQDLLAKFHIFASLNPQSTDGLAFNIGDSEGMSWESVWPEICAYFGLKGVGPRDAASDKEKLAGLEWVMARKEEWGAWVKENGLKEGFVEKASWDMFAGLLEHIPFDRNMELTLSKKIGFEETSKTTDGYIKAFERMRAAKIIP